jgi:hypothetical protein
MGKDFHNFIFYSNYASLLGRTLFSSAYFLIIDFLNYSNGGGSKSFFI